LKSLPENSLTQNCWIHIFGLKCKGAIGARLE